VEQKSHGTPFHDYQHALEFDRRQVSDIRAKLGLSMIESLRLQGGEWVLDVATGTGRYAEPVSERLGHGKIVGLDEALAMLSVGREKGLSGPQSRYLQAAGDASLLPFRSGVFDRAFVAFSLHHFRDPALVVREVRRVLKPKGSLSVLDPVVVQVNDAVDRSVNDLVNQVFGRSHGGIFRFHSAQEIQELLEQERFTVTNSDVHRISFDQDNMEGVPTGRHWLEVAEELDTKSDEMKTRFEEHYFRSWKTGGKAHVKGGLSYAVICGKPS
jgi:ubiquinone/menaquinone biosynthesis C-methylase UbiE